MPRLTSRSLTRAWRAKARDGSSCSSFAASVVIMPVRSRWTLVVSALLVSCSGQRAAESRAQEESCATTEFKGLLTRIQGRWTVGFSDYEFGQKPKTPRTLGTLEFTGCTYRFTPSAPEEIERIGAAREYALAEREMPILKAPSGVVAFEASPERPAYAAHPLGGLLLTDTAASPPPDPWHVLVYEREQEGEYLFLAPAEDSFHRWEIHRGEWRRRPGEYVPGSDAEDVARSAE